ncbi:MAG: hypothetical protein OEW75_03640 [Cyclobacteriaceae bacterium]|nr:hypothetical protein [Cyclobacteriaceae bacterium]
MKEKIAFFLDTYLVKFELVLWVGSILLYSFSVEVFGIMLTLLAVLYFLWGMTSDKAFVVENIFRKIGGISAAISVVGFMFFYMKLPGAVEQLSAGFIGLIVSVFLSWVVLYNGIYKFTNPRILRPHILFLVLLSHGIAEGYLF